MYKTVLLSFKAAVEAEVKRLMSVLDTLADIPAWPVIKNSALGTWRTVANNHSAVVLLERLKQYTHHVQSYMVVSPNTIRNAASLGLSASVAHNFSPLLEPSRG